MSLVIKNTTNAGTYAERLAKGKAYEAEVIAELRAEGHAFRTSNADDDMYSKIDAYATVTPELIRDYRAFGCSGEWLWREVPVQIKHRENGRPDFDYEIFTDRYERGGRGRESKSKASVMIVRANGKKHAASMAGLRKVALSIYARDPEAFQRDERFSLTSSDGRGELKRVEDKGRDNQKPFWKTILYYKP
jgi:hypothetical protein